MQNTYKLRLQRDNFKIQGMQVHTLTHGWFRLRCQKQQLYLSR